jgi:Zn-dependent protease
MEQSSVPTQPDGVVSLDETGSSSARTRRMLRVAWGGMIALGLLAVKLKTLVVFSFAKFKALLVNPFEGFGVSQMAMTGGSMLVSIAAYAWQLKFPLAIGLIAMIFIHELGHALAIRAKGLRAGAMVFIPFVGGAVTLKDQPRSAYDDAQIGLAGPIAGTLASFGSLLIFESTEIPFFLVLAYGGFWLNLLNLCPIGVLDGGRIAAAITKWMWVAGAGILLWMFIKERNFLVLLVLVLAAYQVYMAATGEREAGFYDVPFARRAIIAGIYFGLVITLWFQTVATQMKIAAILE